MPVVIYFLILSFFKGNYHLAVFHQIVITSVFKRQTNNEWLGLAISESGLNNTKGFSSF